MISRDLRKLISAACLTATFAVQVGCQDRERAPIAVPPSASTWEFKDITASSGITTHQRNGREAGVLSILEIVGSGVGMLDYDRDSQLDLVFPTGGQLAAGSPPQVHPGTLAIYRGIGSQQWSEVSDNSGVNSSRHYSHGTAVGDFDNDGFDDLAVTGYGGIDVWQNMGDGSWERMAESSGLVDPAWSSSAGWGDLDGDGNLDLFVTHYVNWSPENNPLCQSPSPTHPWDVCPPRRFNGVDDRILHNRGDGTFEDGSKQWGVASKGKGLGILLADVDDDTDTDAYVTNDTVNNFLYLNGGHGSAEESALIAGCAVDALGKPNGSMGVELFDFNMDLIPDLWVTNYEQESCCLYQGQHDHQFLDVARDTGVASMGELFVSFGTVARDLDGDGDSDIVVANGHVIYYPSKAFFEQQSILLENQEGKRFVRGQFSSDSFFSKRYAARGVAAGDLDGNGTTDLVVTTLDGSPLILSNESHHAGARIRLKLSGTKSNRSATGARVVLTSALGQRVSYLIGGGSYLSASEQVCDFFVPADTGDCSVKIYWPYGEVQEVSGLKPGTDYVVWDCPGQVFALPRRAGTVR